MATPSNSTVSLKKIPAGSVATIDQVGDFFYIVTAPCEINIRSDDGQSFNPYAQGSSYEVPPDGMRFKRLTIQNPSSADIIIRIFIGDGTRYRAERQSVLPPPTRVRHVASTIAANSGVLLDGVVTGDMDVQRAAILLSNTETTLSCEIRDASGLLILAKIRPLDNISLPLSGPCQVWNPNGTPMQVHIAEIIYTA